MRWSRLILATVAMTLAVTLSSLAPALAQQADPNEGKGSPRQIAAKSFPSVALLVMMDKKGKSVSFGSGFVVLPGVIATNYHVIQGAYGGKLRFVGEKKQYKILGAVGLDVWADVALVRIKDTKHPPLPIGLSGRVAVGDRVFVIGNPKGLVGTFSEGLISAIRRLKNGKDYTFQMSAPISRGSSGGPVVNAKGEVIGMSRSMLLGGQNLNFAVPSLYVVKLMANMTPPRPLSAVPVVNRFGRKTGRSTRGRVPKPELLMGPGTEGVALTRFLWASGGFTRFSFSIKNNRNKAVNSVELHAVHYDNKGEVVDNYRWTHKGSIAPGMAVRVERGVKTDLFRLTSKILVSVVQTTPSN